MGNLRFLVVLMSMVLLQPLPAFSNTVKSKKITKITFSPNEKSKKRKYTPIEKAIKNSEKKKLVGLNYDVKNPEDLTYDPALATKKKRKLASLPEKKSIPRDPAADNPIVEGSSAKLPAKKSDVELVQDFQKAANSQLEDEFGDESL